MDEPIRYELRLLGRFGPAARDGFADLGIRVEPTTTRLSGALDQPALHTLLERIKVLGLEVVDVRRVGWGSPGYLAKARSGRA